MSEPELRTTPGGTPVLRLVVDCGADGEALRLGVVMTGESGRDLSQHLKAGTMLVVEGRLRGLKRNLARAAVDAGVEVLASRIEAMATG
ncbi:MAG TPA: single-stranded DNA-binding protein [Candidatus Binataceae bacterium]